MEFLCDKYFSFTFHSRQNIFPAEVSLFYDLEISPGTLNKKLG